MYDMNKVYDIIKIKLIERTAHNARLFSKFKFFGERRATFFRFHENYL